MSSIDPFIAEQIAKTFKLSILEVTNDSFIFTKQTGGKIIASKTDEGYSVYGIVFVANNLSDSLYWAIQFALHCR